MKKIAIIAILLLLVGCAQTVTEDTSETDTTGFEETQNERESADSKTDVEIGGVENAAKLEEIMSVSDKSRIYPSSKKLGIGDQYQFAIGVGNPLSNDLNLYAEVSFKEAKDKYTNTIFVEEEDINAWISERTFDLTAEPQEFDIKVITIEVGDVQKGTYIFGLDLYEKETMNWETPKLYHRNDFAIIVQ